MPMSPFVTNTPEGSGEHVTHQQDGKAAAAAAA